MSPFLGIAENVKQSFGNYSFTFSDPRQAKDNLKIEVMTDKYLDIHQFYQDQQMVKAKAALSVTGFPARGKDNEIVLVARKIHVRWNLKLLRTRS